MDLRNIILWVVKIIVAFILLQTLYYKFTAHPDSVFIFEQTGLGAVGRIGAGIAELIIALLILTPRTAWLGAAGGIGMMAGAIFFHLTSLGIEVNNDGGILFKMAFVVLVGCIYILIKHRNNIPFLKTKSIP